MMVAVKECWQQSHLRVVAERYGCYCEMHFRDLIKGFYYLNAILDFVDYRAEILAALRSKSVSRDIDGSFPFSISSLLQVHL